MKNRRGYNVQERALGMKSILNWRPSCILSLAAAIMIVAAGPSAYAQAISCDALIDKLTKSAEEPRVAINPINQTVLVTSTQGHCSESIEEWSMRTQGRGLRGLFKKPETKQPPPPTRQAPPTEEQEPVDKDQRPELLIHPLDKQAPLPKPAQPLGSEVKSTESCSLQLKEYWRGTTLEINGSVYWLISVYTIDLNKDLVTDNVGFRLISSKRKELIIRYFDSRGGLAAKSIPELRLEDETVIPKFCFGQLNFEANLEPVDIGEKKMFEVPDLAKEAEDRKRAAEKGDGWGMGIWITLFAIVLVLAVGGFFLWRHLSSGKTKEAEDPEEETDEDDPFA